MVNQHLSRRNLFGAAALSFTPAGAAAEKNIRWALGIVTWVVIAGRDKRSLGWPEILADIAAGGFQGVEPFTQKTLPITDASMADLARLLPKHNLRVSSIYWADNFHVAAEHPRIEKECHRFLRYLKTFGADRLTIGPPGPTTDDEKRAISNMAKVMNYVGKTAIEQYGIKTGVHNHVDGLIENPRQIDQLMEETDPRFFGLSPDTAQIWMGGGDPVRMFEKYKNRIVYMHYKDIRGYHRGLPGYLDNVIELGRGVIDFPALHRVLKSVGYKGWITIDLDNARVSPLESAKIQRDYIDRVLAPIYA
ncbi:MAG: TIM barrel protein [Bryobacteraceae bacterium]|nr:TIM barrel protein [Bryobacteraceae bacterium]